MVDAVASLGDIKFVQVAIPDSCMCIGTTSAPSKAMRILPVKVLS